MNPYFTQVSLSRYEDNLEITEIEPIMAYIRSGMRVNELSQAELENLQDELKRKLKENGSIFITKDSGLFETIK